MNSTVLVFHPPAFVIMGQKRKRDCFSDSDCVIVHNTHLGAQTKSCPNEVLQPVEERRPSKKMRSRSPSSYFSAQSVTSEERNTEYYDSFMDCSVENHEVLRTDTSSSGLSLDEASSSSSSSKTSSSSSSSPSSSSSSLGGQQVQGPDQDIDNDILGRYRIVKKLGEGGYGTVFEAVRVMDGLEVAMKVVLKNNDLDYLSIPGHPTPLPLEVALTILANEGPNVPQIIQMLEWQERPDSYIMILERPSPCEDLFDFLERHGGTLSEDMTRHIMWQVVQAAHMCCQRGVLHRDIKLENLLINKETLEVKLIDFGCGDLLKTSAYTTFCGTEDYCPPEYRSSGRYYGKAATVWSLGVLLYELLCGEPPKHSDLELTNERIWIKSGLSKECCQLVQSCLQRSPKKRIALGKLSSHSWFKVFNSTFSILSIFTQDVSTSVTR
ncbi:serine/threonine-protein kinase pim-1-like [Danio aesculapii]|uniref:serine/threonine-protein kinase pim-1-like n=1 Tax=Danio aesculapii TaxID=1142201 RepID=UPI0024BF33F4|nr:serine/threonine-protein kinase pim-1-like [Danio aesculapii]